MTNELQLSRGYAGSRVETAVLIRRAYCRLNITDQSETIPNLMIIERWRGVFEDPPLYDSCDISRPHDGIAAISISEACKRSLTDAQVS